MLNADPRDAERVPDDHAQRLLARAAELDATQGAGMTIAQLRAIALDVGISPASLDAALAEYALPGNPTSHGVEPMRPHHSFWQRHLLPLAVVAGSALLLFPLVNALGLYRAFGMLSALPLALGAYAAFRTRSPVIRTLLAGYAIAIFVDEYIHYLVGYPRLGQASPEHWGISVAALAGSLIAVLMTRAPSPPPRSSMGPRLMTLALELRRRVIRSIRALRGWELRRVTMLPLRTS